MSVWVRRSERLVDDVCLMLWEEIEERTIDFLMRIFPIQNVRNDHSDSKSVKKGSKGGNMTHFC